MFLTVISKALQSIWVTPSGIVTVSTLQYLNASSPIVYILEGRLIFFRDVHLLANAKGNDVTPSGI